MVGSSIRSTKLRKKSETLLGEIEVIHDQTNQVYGSPREHQELLDHGHDCCVNRVAKLMQQNEIRAKAKEKIIATTNSNHSQPVARNLLNLDFDSPQKSKLLKSLQFDSRKTATDQHELNTDICRMPLCFFKKSSYH